MALNYVYGVKSLTNNYSNLYTIEEKFAVSMDEINLTTQINMVDINETKNYLKSVPEPLLEYASLITAIMFNYEGLDESGLLAADEAMFIDIAIKPFTRIVKGDQKFNRTSKGSFWCTNPLRISVRYKRVIKSRDALSALAISIVGLSTLLFGVEPPPFNNRVSRISTEDYIIKTSIFFNLRVGRQPT
ncbi:hypothetical protein INT48_009117 [Thamnidium elegans]|uniref:Uncharacterized protein n=1 Tax=Thamnidium elegans TaxID=101142 RepID=A0A8H7VY53_9FUNG|nr:hypothetical protein INT48_009117 [Thamnidium elegans]